MAAGRVVSLKRQSLIVVCAGLLFVGGAAGFGIGFKVEQSRVKTAAHATIKTKGNTKATTAAKQLQRLRTCLASHGLKWPVIPGKFGKQVRTPPAGVAVATYKGALLACYGT